MEEINKSQKTMATVILPHDMMEDILSRLPIKSLERLRCMSKSSNSLISKDQLFARMQLNRALQSPKSSSQKILLSSPSPSDLRSLDYEKGNSLADEGSISRLVFPAKTPHNLPMLVVGSCHGLLCLAFDNDKDFYLWNPTTGDYNKLPHPPCLVPDKRPTADHILVRYFSFVYGFGYDSFSDDYKVLLGLKIPWFNKVEQDDKLEHEVKFAIFSMRDNCWRIIQQLSPIKLASVRRIFGCNLVNGTLNWLVGSKCLSFDMTDCAIVAFDLKSERFMELPMPDIDTPIHCTGLGILEGRLCLSVATPRRSSYLIELWVMNEYGVGQSWTRLLYSPFGSFESPNLLQYPLCISKDNQIIFAGGGTKLASFDATTRRKIEGCDLCKCGTHYYPSSETDKSSYYECETVIYFESLVSPNLDKHNGW